MLSWRAIELENIQPSRKGNLGGGLPSQIVTVDLNSTSFRYKHLILASLAVICESKHPLNVSSAFDNTSPSKNLDKVSDNYI